MGLPRYVQGWLDLMGCWGCKVVLELETACSNIVAGATYESCRHVNWAVENG